LVTHRFLMRLSLPKPFWIVATTVVLVIVMIALLIWLPNQRADQFVAEVEGLGGHVWPLVAGPEWQIWKRPEDREPLCYLWTRIHTVTLDEIAVEETWWPKLRRFPEIRRLFLTRTSLTDQGLLQLNGLRNLRWLEAIDTRITGPGLAALQDAHGLLYLDLSGCPLADEGLQHLAGAQELFTLCLNDTNVTDAGMVHIKQLHGLAELELSGTRVTDIGLQELDALNLQKLHVRNTHVTQSGVDRFSKKSPSTCVLFETPASPQ